ncbi:nesprin-3 isoform X1 [Osmerus eperlanus]|uniref:nesprin-3 isoform X1 n=1 Tax=Osmerus eperlanus TaxID=29151 RepID=UPI002E13AE5C
MTQQEQREFSESLEAALCWMQAIQERLRTNDNTQGPRAALEARLRETEKIHESEHDGRVKMDMVLVAAEVLLQNGDEETRNQTHTKLKDLKALWEDTCTYIIHCHSRIEWVWLHWSEYLKAYEEFELWLAKLRRTVDAEAELQLGVKEKLWQVDHLRVIVSDVQAQAPLLERLLDEAAALHNRTQDPSVDPQAQESLQEAYNNIRDQSEERLALLQKMAEEHQMYQNSVLKFQSWLVSKTGELSVLMEREGPPENRLKALQTLDDSVASEEKTLQHIEGLAEAVHSHTSPAGAEVVVEEAEELRLGWQRLRQGLYEAGEGLRFSLDSQSQYLARCQRLGKDIAQLRAQLQGLGRELEGREAGERTEEQMVVQWRKYTNVRNALVAEESQVEHLKTQLKELFCFSQDSRHLSDDVLAAVKEHQSVKCRAGKLCSEAEAGLRQVLQDPLHVFSQWSQRVSQVLEASNEVSEFSHIARLVQDIERLLKPSLQLQERLSLLQVKTELLTSVLGQEGAEGLLDELGGAMRNREILHSQLLQRKSRLQGLISRTKDFGDAYESIRKKLTPLRDRLVAADSFQPDILAKKSQSDQLRVVKKDLEDCEAHIMALETLVSSSQTNSAQYERLYGDWKLLYKTVRVRVKDSEESIAEHETFHESLLNVEKWLMIMRQKLESYQSPSGEWSVDNREQEAQRALGEFPEKELQLHQIEAQGQGVLERTSEQGRVHILSDMRRLRESWMALHDLSLNLYRLLNSHSSNSDLHNERVRGHSGDHTSTDNKLLCREGGSQLMASKSSNSQRQGQPEGTPEQGPSVWACEKTGPELGGRMEERQEDNFVAGQRGVGRGQGVWVQGGFEESNMGAMGSSPMQVRKLGTFNQTPSRLQDEASQRAGSGGGHTGRGKEGERGRQGPGVEEVDSWGGTHLTGQDRETLGGSLTLRRGRSPQTSGGLGLPMSSDRTEEWVDEQRSRDTVETQAASVRAGYGHGSRKSSRHGIQGEDEVGRSEGERLGEGGAFTSVGKASGLTPLSLRNSATTTRDVGATQHVEGSPGQALSTAEYEESRGEFEAWLLRENEVLSGILNTRGSLSSKELKIRQDTLKALRSGVGWGQEQFQSLLQVGQRPGSGVRTKSEPGVDDMGLEELRYRWMLYKSKLKDVGDLKTHLSVKGVRAGQDETTKIRKQKSPSLLYRVCRVALPLQILLLALLLLAFLLPLMDEGASCSLSNNFARSFNIMLRYDGPPPT